MTQDVGSDPTVCAPGSDDVCFCCMLCGMELGEWEEEGGMLEEEEREGGGKGGIVKVFDLSEISGVENDEDGDEDEEMGGERDTTGNDDDDHDMTRH